jgi:hypothetical protein
MGHTRGVVIQALDDGGIHRRRPDAPAELPDEVASRRIDAEASAAAARRGVAGARRSAAERGSRVRAVAIPPPRPRGSRGVIERVR